MAEVVVTASQGVLGPLLGKLGNVLADEGARLKGVRREIILLRSELLSMNAAVQNYTRLQDPDVQAKIWISMVRELAYDTEDVIDKFIHHLGNGGNHGCGFKKFFRKTARRLRTLRSRHGIAKEIDDLKVRVNQVKDLKISYKLDGIVSGNSEHTVVDRNSEHTAVDPRLSALFIEEEHLVGIDGPRKDLSNWMLEEDDISFKDLKVLSIVGFGGLGKTTLANQVYQRIKHHFQCHAFVSVSQNPDFKRIIKDIIKDLISQVPCDKAFSEDIGTWDVKECITKLRDLLQDKRYLVVVDDIWSIQAWNSIKYAFPRNIRSSRVITTTRIADVARSCCPSGSHRVYEMEALSDVNSKRLFFNRIFGSEAECPRMLKDISDDILKKCGGLPLAITSLSGLLASKQIQKEEWEKVHRSIGSAMHKTDSLQGMRCILSLSYNDLPPYLRTCLLYLGIFPEDTKYYKKDLVMRWIAEGFISEDCRQSRREIAESYFYELINRNIVQPLDIGVDGKVNACRVHDMMLELIISKSAEDNFITVIRGGQTVLAPNHGCIRRLSIQNIDQELASVLENQDLKHVRCLIVTASYSTRYLPRLSEFESLRVLDFGLCRDVEEQDIKDIGKLFHLKYLSLRDSLVSYLPSGIVMLHDLDTLDLRGTYIQELPAGIIQLIKLQHLLLPSGYFRTKIPVGIGNMKNLRVVKGFNVTRSSVCAVEELGNLAGLEELHIEVNNGVSKEYEMHEEMLLSSLGKLGSCKLQSLWITSSVDTSLQFLDCWSPLPLSLKRFRMITNYFLTKTPKWITPASTNLTYLDINLVHLTEEDLHRLGEIPALLSLVVTFMGVQKERLTIGSSIAFPCLKEFGIRYSHMVNSAIYLTFAEGALPMLERLRLPFFVSLAKSYDFYLGLCHLACLRYARVILCYKVDTSSESKAAKGAIRKEADNHPNHPRVIILDRTEKDHDEEENCADKEESNARGIIY